MCQFRAYKLSEASVISPIANLLPILLVGTSFIFLGITPKPGGFVGILLVVAGVYYSSVSGEHDVFHPLQQLVKNPGSRSMLITVRITANNVWLYVRILDYTATASPAVAR